ncbi:MAG: acetyl-CoA carboxylase carboxyltransferase subunit alpha [Rhizobiaceae bacterium]|jgi:acetyl-CoA carboxylase carboxyl transferase subunit alpha|nr:acetyl-CoA carboxylase carboxyltransferase subunit alpha [Rhizobiaceae bacterium]
MVNYLEFEKAVADLEGQIHELRSVGKEDGSVDLSDEVSRLEAKSKDILKSLYAKLSPWEKTQVARHPDRPHFIDYQKAMITDFTPLAGDRYFGEDHAVFAGLGRFDGRSVAIIGQEKGMDTQSRLKHNFGMARPEGYRKAIRIMDMAERYNLPVISLVDTAGAYPGVGAEARGQAEAIARSTERCLTLEVPMIATIIGEGGSGGAIAIAAANRVYMLEHAIYSVISPEAGASILWRDPARAKDIATTMKITAQDLKEMGIVDGIIDEPVGGAHRNREAVFEAAKTQIASALSEFDGMQGDQIRKMRQEKFLAMGRNLS